MVGTKPPGKHTKEVLCQSCIEPQIEWTSLDQNEVSQAFSKPQTEVEGPDAQHLRKNPQQGGQSRRLGSVRDGKFQQNVGAPRPTPQPRVPLRAPWAHPAGKDPLPMAKGTPSGAGDRRDSPYPRRADRLMYGSDGHQIVLAHV